MHSFRVTRAIFYFSVGVVCSSAHASKLEEYLEKARLRDPTYLNSKQLMSVAEEDLKISESALGPRISLGATAQRTERLEENRTLFGSTDVSRRFDSSNVNLQARQPIVRIRDRLSVEQAKFKRDSARYALIAAEQDLYIRFISAWVDILSANELLIAYKESRGVIEELVQESVRRLASGESTIQDLEQVKAKVAQSDALVEQSHFLVESARLSFELILGEKFLIPQSLRFSLFPMFSLQGMTQLSLLQSIESRNPEIMSYKLAESAARIEREKAQSERFPTVDAVASAMRGQNSSFNFIKDEKNVGLQVTIPIYTHGAIDASIASADASYRRAQAQTQLTINRIQLEARSAFGSLSVFTSRSIAADRAYSAANTVLKAQRSGLRAGINSRAEVAQAVADLLSAQREKVQIRKDFVSAWLKIQAVQGDLNLERLADLEKLVSIEAR